VVFRAEGFGARPDLATKADDGSGNEGEPRRPPRPSYPDSQQVFVGNLPAQVIDFELRDFFKSMYICMTAVYGCTLLKSDVACADWNGCL